ncbi:MAG: LysM peptidoglycan-binding domain-containing protein [Chloroflexi bacterium]|nr:LysM peptidoglycan-binding domain-containing protein [Chloroflexota bacterium]
MVRKAYVSVLFLLILFASLAVTGCDSGKKETKIEPLDLSGPIATLTRQAQIDFPVTLTPSKIPTSTPKPVKAQQSAVLNIPANTSQKLDAIPTLRADMVTYEIAEGDTISKIATSFQISKKALIEANDLANPDIISVGQKLNIPPQTPDIQDEGFLILPDADMIYGPAVSGFQLAEFNQEFPNSYLIGYIEPTPTPIPTKEAEELTEPVLFEARSGSEILEQIALQNSVNPKVLLALMEFQTASITNPRPNGNQRLGVLVHLGLRGTNFANELAWTADKLNYGYYQWKNNRINQWILNDDTVVAVNPEINAATAALQYFFSQIYGKDDWLYAVSEFGFNMTYRKLFDITEINYRQDALPASFPELSFPFPAGETWNFTSGPHYGWSNGTPWSAVDFIPPKVIGCESSDAWVVAAADGIIIYSDRGVVLQDLDGDGDPATGWLLVYLHIATRDRIANGQTVVTGDYLGHTSCEGGISNGTHIHFARRYNGEWIPIDSETPLIMSGWTVVPTGSVYDGFLVKGDQSVEAWYFRTEASEISY